MGNGKVVALCIVGGLALIGIIVAIVLRSGVSSTQGTPGTLGQRLLAHSRDRNDYRLFVGVPSANPTAWVEVARIDGSSVTLRNSQGLDLSEVRACFVAYPSGALVDYRCPNELPVPEWVSFPENSGPPDRAILTATDLKAGVSLVRVEFGKSTSEPRSRHHYSTTLTNVSGKRVRVLKFRGYTRAGTGFSLNTITSRFFTAEDFKEWYGQKGEWIDPGQSVTDPNNYGSPPCLVGLLLRGRRWQEVSHRGDCRVTRREPQEWAACTEPLWPRKSRGRTRDGDSIVSVFCRCCSLTLC